MTRQRIGHIIVFDKKGYLANGTCVNVPMTKIATSYVFQNKIKNLVKSVASKVRITPHGYLREHGTLK